MLFRSREGDGKKKSKKALQEKLQKLVNEKATKKKSKMCNHPSLEYDITHPLYRWPSVSFYVNERGQNFKD